MAPDLDVLIRSDTDPLLFLEYHRQFTHSLIFIPLGALICALLLSPVARRLGSSMAFKTHYFFCLLGYATHALLDACTTYGTMLLWPFIDARFAWNNMSIIDPLYTLPILALLIIAYRKRTPRLALLTMSIVLLYPLLGLWQHHRAVEAGWELATERGHTPSHLDAKPSFSNLLVWKLIYEFDGRYYVDAVRMGQQRRYYTGESIAILDRRRDLPWLQDNTQQARDLERFRWFSNNYLARDPIHPNRVIDVRFSLMPNEIDALWFIELDPDADHNAHVVYGNKRERTDEARARSQLLWQMISDG
jgi:inner membrane protein